MNPIEVSQTLHDAFVSYLATTFDVNRDGNEELLARAIHRSFTRPGALFRGPYLELTPPYMTGGTLQQLAAEGVISPDLLGLPCFAAGQPLPPDAPLYTHQEAAIRKLCVEQESVVISSGTGSGKTEGFLIPILNDLLLDPSPGVRAVLIYPMNALVNDQLDRLRVLLRGTGITFGRYTSELNDQAAKARLAMQAEWQQMSLAQQQLLGEYPLPNEIIGRDQIREQGALPQILITNYAMLEYLLLRPADQPLFLRGQWKFIVLDEAHSYSGAQGIEVGMLMRRLKHRLGKEPGETLCVATSATLTNDDADQAAQFAGALFGEPFSSAAIIFGKPDHDYVPPVTETDRPDPTAYLHPSFADLLTEMRRAGGPRAEETALHMEEIGVISEDDLALIEGKTAPQFLWRVLQCNADVQHLRQFMAGQSDPISFTDVAAELFRDRLADEEHQKEALYHLIELAAMARPDPEKSPLIPARYHLFARPPQGLWVCLNRDCPGREHGTEAEWSRLFADPRERCDSCQAAVYPLTVCRTCGQPYVRAEESNHCFLSEAAALESGTVHYFTWQPIHQDIALSEGGEELVDDEVELPHRESLTPFPQDPKGICLRCRYEVRNGRCNCADAAQAIHITLFAVMAEEKRGNRSRKTTVSAMKECPRCRDQSYSGTEIVTPVRMSTAAPLSIMTGKLYRLVPPAAEPEQRQRAGGGRKLLTFYDSRQGAAQFAAYLQDSTNQDTYAHLIPKAIELLEQKYGYADFSSLAERAMEMAVDFRVFHNDATIDSKDLPRQPGYLEQHQRERLQQPLRTRLLAEFTTRRRARSSFEALCLVGVYYAPPDKGLGLGKLPAAIGMNDEQAQTLIGYLLDDLRSNKVVTLPAGVNRDDELFGRHKFSPRVVRGSPDQYQIGWLGQTPRHRRRQLVEKALRHCGLPHQEANVVDVLQLIWEWLTAPDSTIMDTSRPADGFQIRHERLFFRTNIPCFQCTHCRRYSYRSAALPCPHPHCEGKLEQANPPVDNFYASRLRAEIVPMRVEEHTAQLTPEKGRRYQDAFKQGLANVLSCSTTFEMGIDLGDLQAVVMSNVPPTVANYKQRSGRAGRRASGTAFILTWASDRPHDQSYFRTPADIISGRIRVPHIEIQNDKIIQRHVNAIIVSAFLRHQQQLGRSDLKEVGSFFDEQTVGGPHYDYLHGWLETNKQEMVSLLGRFAPRVGRQKEAVLVWLDGFEKQMREYGAERYQLVSNFYKQVLHDLNARQAERLAAGDMSSMSAIEQDFTHFRRLLKRTREEDVINFLSDKGVLPSYSFPLHTVELRVDSEADLRLQRDLRQAIREYAPGQEIVADKRIWTSGGLDYFGKEPEQWQYRICPDCNHLDITDTAGKPLTNQDEPCSICGYEYRKKNEQKPHYFIKPDGFRADKRKSGQAARQTVLRERNVTKAALLPGETPEAQRVSDLLELAYDRQGSLLYVNEGFQGVGFHICLQCGKALSKAGKCNASYRGETCAGTAPANGVYSLGFRDQTDTLHFHFYSTPDVNVPSPDDMEFWLSLKYALLHGASRALQIERRDIDGVLFPRKGSGTEWRQTIVLFDNVPGGAGHVKRIQEEIGSVVGAALDIVNCECAEDTSCYGCLRDYHNQWEHHLLRRGRVLDFLRALHAGLNALDANLPGMYEVPAANIGRWLFEQIAHAQQELIVVAERITLESPDPHVSWLDLLHTLLVRGTEVCLYLSEWPAPRRDDPGSLVIAEQLRSLLTRGLILSVTKRPAPWQVAIDGNTESPRAIQLKDGALALDAGVGSEGLISTTHREAVRAINAAFADFGGQRLDRDALRLPAEVTVSDTSNLLRASEQELFGELFQQPVRGLIINDRFLLDEERIVNRLGNYVRLAAQGGSLEEVHVSTYPAGDSRLNTSRVSLEEQSRSIAKLERQFPLVAFSFRRTDRAQHDRFIELHRIDGVRARILIGQGLDFINPDGSVRPTYIVIEDPYDH